MFCFSDIQIERYKSEKPFGKYHLSGTINLLEAIMKHKRILITTLLFTFLAATMAFSWGTGSGMQDKGVNKKDKNARCVSSGEALTEEQQEKLAQLRETFFKETANQRIDLRAKEARLGVLLGDAEPDKAAINKLVNEIASLQKALLEKRVAHRLAVKEIAPELGRFGGGPGIERSGCSDGRGFYQGPGQGQFYGKGQGSGFDCRKYCWR